MRHCPPRERAGDRRPETGEVRRFPVFFYSRTTRMKDRAHGNLSKIQDRKGRGVGHDPMLTKNFKESQWIRKILIRRHFLTDYDGTRQSEYPT